MAFTFDASPKALITERRAQFSALGQPASITDAVAARLGHELWKDEPTSWVYASGPPRPPPPRLAGICWSRRSASALPNTPAWATMPTRTPTTNSSGPISTPRGLSPWSSNGGSSASITTARPRPLRSTSTGVPDVIVVGLDGPGVGESKVASQPDGDLIFAGVAEQVRGLGNGKVGAAAWSFGATWAVKLALRSEVDAAVAVGGPVEMAFDVSTISTWPNGMAGIMGNSLHRDKPFADAQETATELGRFRLSAQGLLGDWGPGPTPLLVANGAKDPYVPAVDTTMF
jgi:hypothetical protein